MPEKIKITKPVHKVKNKEDNNLREYFEDIFYGFYPYYLFFAISVIIYRIKKKLWTKAETILLSACLIHTLGILAQIFIFYHQYYVSSRYLIPAMPLYFCWTAIFLIAIINFFKRNLTPKLNKVVFIVIICGITIALILDGSGPIIKDYTSNKKSMRRKHSLFMANAIKKDFTKRNITRFYRPELDIFSYKINKQPFIYSNDLNVVSYLADGSNKVLSQSNQADYIIYSCRESVNALNNKSVKIFRSFKNYSQIAEYFSFSRDGKYRYSSYLFFHDWRSKR